MSFEIVAGKTVRLSRLVRRITQNNPGLLTGPGTNTYIVGSKFPILLDPGSNSDEHFEAVCAEAGGGRVVGVAPTHSHPDHWPLAPRLAERLSTVTMGFREGGGYLPMRLLKDGDEISSPEWQLRIIHTPGHSSDHTCFYLAQEKALFTGDHLMGWSTTMIAPPDGNLKRYLASLSRLLDLDVAVSYPAHGLPVGDTIARARELIDHRNMRTAQILSALRAGSRTIPAIVAEIYTDVDPRLHPLARNSVLAHLEALIESGAVVVEDSVYTVR